MGLSSGKCMSKARLDGKTVIITGANTGIGKSTAIDLYKRGACVIMACRNLEKAEGVRASCIENANGSGKMEIVQLDLANLKSVRECAEELSKRPKIDYLINNAGVMCCPYSKTVDGYEMQFQSNYLGHFLLTLLLLPKIIQSQPARIVNVSSLAHNSGILDLNDLNFDNKPYKALRAYEQSKLCNVLFTKELARRLKESNIGGVTTYALHPGIISTELGRHMDTTYFKGFSWISRHTISYFFKTPDQGAQTTIYCTVDEGISNETGLYYSDCKVKEPAKQAQNMEDAERLWNASLKMVGLENYKIN